MHAHDYYGDKLTTGDRVVHYTERHDSAHWEECAARIAVISPSGDLLQLLYGGQTDEFWVPAVEHVRINSRRR